VALGLGCAATPPPPSARRGGAAAAAREASGRDGAARIAVSDDRTCAWSSARGLWCWSSESLPRRVRGVDASAALLVDGSRFCGLSADGALRCGDGVWADHVVALLSSSSRSDYFVRGDGALCRLGETRCSAAPALVSGPFALGSAAEGFDQAVYVTGGGRLCTGAARPRCVESTTSEALEELASAAIGRTMGCAVRRDGVVVCWGPGMRRLLAAPAPAAAGAENRGAGAGAHGEQGDGGDGDDGDGGGDDDAEDEEESEREGTPNAHESWTLANIDEPRNAALEVYAIEDVTQAVGVSVGADHACAWSAAGEVWCWGANDAGQVGDGTTRPRRKGVRIELRGIASVAAGTRRTCAVDRRGEVWCWGDHATRREEGGSRTHLEDTGLTGATDLRGTTDAYCVLFRGGEVRCFGDWDPGDFPFRGDLRHGGAAVPARGPVASMVVTSAVVCVRLVDGHAQCWGPEPLMHAVASVTAAVDEIAIVRGRVCLRTGSRISCLGENDAQEITAPAPVRAMAGMSRGLCVILEDATVTCARLSGDDVDWHPQPSLAGAIALEAETSRTCVLTRRGDVGCVDADGRQTGARVRGARALAGPGAWTLADGTLAGSADARETLPRGIVRATSRSGWPYFLLADGRVVHVVLGRGASGWERSLAPHPLHAQQEPFAISPRSAAGAGDDAPAVEDLPEN